MRNHCTICLFVFTCAHIFYSSCARSNVCTSGLSYFVFCAKPTMYSAFYCMLQANNVFSMLIYANNLLYMLIVSFQ